MVNVPDDLYVERKGRIERVVAQARLLDATPGVDRSGSRPTAPVAPRVGPVRMRHPRIASNHVAAVLRRARQAITRTPTAPSNPIA
jgi:hypothetical protein